MEDADDAFIDADNLCGQTLLRLVSRGNSIMAELLKEANAGAFATKGQAIDRRDELLAERNSSPQTPPAATAMPETSSNGN